MAKVTLVSPDGKDKQDVEVDSKLDIKLRWDGYRPEAKAEAPKVSAGGNAPKA